MDMSSTSEWTAWQKWSERDWENWLNDRLDERKEVFGSDPDELTSSYNRERSHASSYEGRELLELVQNADDSGAEYSKPNKMLIKLTPNALYIANTGIPFSPEGIKSLMVSDNSPKQFQRGRCIGYRGLGFRSVLGWASSIVILSGKLSIGFSEKRAIEWLKDLMDKNTKVRKKVEKVEQEGLLHPIATLSIPYFFDSAGSKNMLSAETHQTLYELYNNGYDTIICLVFDKAEETCRKVQKQIESIGPEILLFLQYLERLEIVTPETNVMWDVKRHENEVIINPESKERQVWRLFSDSGEIPKEYRRPDQPLASRYEIKLATLHKDLKTYRLFVYFPTEVLFPFPLIAHTTFELTDNRQHLIESDINRFIASRLAKLIADSTEKLVDPENPWSALLSVTPRGDIDPVLLKLGFEEKLKDEITSRKIVPVRSKEFESAKNAKLIDGDFDDLLVSEEFEDICLYTEDEFLRKRLSDIGVEPIKYDDLKQRLNKLSRTTISMGTRAEIIYRLIENRIVKDDLSPPDLLMDENGVLIPAGTRALLPPEGKKFSLPEWFQQRIMNSELATLLKEKFRLTRVRELVSKLRAFEVQEYSMAALASAIVAETNRRVKEEPDKELKLRQEMLQAVWALYSAQKPEEIPTLPETINVILPAREGSFRSANSLYLGKEYPGGELLEYFYGAIGGSFVASPVELGLQGEINEIKSFLCWLGVAELPRVVKIEKGRSEFLDYVLEGLQYPAKFEDVIVHNKDEARRMYPRMINVSTLDRLEDVLIKADPHAIIAWIVRSSEKLSSWRTSGDIDAKLTISPPYKQYRRQVEDRVLPSYPLWVLKNTKWIPLVNGEKQSPSICTLARGVSKEVSALVGYPSLSLEHPLLKNMKVDRATLKNALTTAGVVTELDELPWDSFYEILLELPQKDPEGKVARSVYRALIARGGDSETPSGEKYDKFIKEGKMFGRLGEKTGYFPVDELYYFENPTLPQSMLRLFPSLDLDRRRGAAKVKKFFGVEPFSLSTANIKIRDFEEHPCSHDFQKEVDRLKPYIYALRVEEDSDRSELRSLRQLKVKLCRSAKCSLNIGNEEKEITLQPSESIVVDSVVYLVAEPLEYDKPFIRDEIIADALGDVITNILKVEIGGDIARLATCSNVRLGVLLDKITGGSGDGRLKKAEELMNLPIVSEEEEFAKPPLIPLQAPELSQPSLTSLPISKTESESELSLVRSASVGPVSVSGGDQVQIVQSREIKRRVMVNAKPKSTISTRRSPVNPDRAENLAIEFEKAQGRFAEKVSHFQGSEAFGCDILSFNSKEDLENFKSKADSKLIERFIEVKGRVNSVGAVTLGGNELTCAQNNRSRFFLYRIYESEKTGAFELVETPDPLGVETGALKVQYEIHPFKTKCSRHWDVIETDGEEEEQEAEHMGEQLVGDTGKDVEQRTNEREDRGA
jgi:hypothetical protein